MDSTKHERKRYHGDDRLTYTSRQQYQIESMVEKCFENNRQLDGGEIRLFRPIHVKYLQKSLFEPMNDGFSFMDTSRTWMTYWISLSLQILGDSKFLEENDYKLTSFLKQCESKRGGYGGGPGQEPHLASTYGAVSALVTIGTPNALQSIDRDGIKRFLTDMQQPDGSFTLHESGEIDIRGVYCALSVAKLLDIPICCEPDGLFSNTAKWILSCQTYEGGFGAGPGNEAHGGYTFCGVASLVMLDKLHLCDIESLISWTAFRQQYFEGGFSGRTNKLVDACYSFWNGAVIPIIQAWMAQKNMDCPTDRWLFNQKALQEYILICCQHRTGGLIDKPGKNRDYYHTCYALSGLSIAQRTLSDKLIIVGDLDNIVEPVHPLFNVPVKCLKACREFVSKTI